MFPVKFNRDKTHIPSCRNVINIKHTTSVYVVFLDSMDHMLSLKAYNRIVLTNFQHTEWLTFLQFSLGFCALKIFLNFRKLICLDIPIRCTPTEKERATKSVFA